MVTPTPKEPQSRELEALLEHPAIWCGRSAARVATRSTGYAELDAALPGGGWPAQGLVEILTSRSGVGEIQLLVPLLVQSGQLAPPRWAAWVAPPFEPYAPALVAAGVPLAQQLIIRTAQPLWAIEQALSSGGCAMVLGWPGPRPGITALRRLQLAAQRGGTPAFLFRPLGEATCSSIAELRIVCEPLPMAQPGVRPGTQPGAQLQLLKSRGGLRSPFSVHWNHGQT